MPNENSQAEWPRYRSHKVVRAAVIYDVIEVDGFFHVLVKPYDDDRVERFVPTVVSMIPHAEVGGFAVVYDNDFNSISPKKAFEEGYSLLTDSVPGTKVLMSNTNPTGWKLEELLPQICAELREKCARIEGDPNPVAQTVLAHNHDIIRMLTQATVKQRHSMEVLDTIGPDQGPLGKARIGRGS
jgi:hypothetical protein